MKEIKIGHRIVKEYSRPFVIAEVGANFNGDLDIAKDMIIKAKNAGVDAVKFQCWSKHNIFVKSIWENKPAEIQNFGHKNQEDLLDYLALDHDGHRELEKFCRKNEILFASTPTSFDDIEFLDELDVPFFKIASMDLNHISFIECIAKKNRPIVISTGLGSNEEIATALETIKSTGNNKIILLHCIALYPPRESEVNLNNIDDLRNKFDVQVGFSDHTIGYGITIASMAKGVSVIEKHYTLDKTMAGWDHSVSATPDEFGIIIQEGKRVCKALGQSERILGERETANKINFRRSIVAARDLNKDKVINFDDLDFKRPADGLSPSLYEKFLGKKLNKDVQMDDQLQLSDIE